MSDATSKNGKARREPDFDLDACDDVQDLLFEYMERELGESRSAFVREHLRFCPACSLVAAEIQAAFDGLKADADGVGIPEQLTDTRRKRLRWAAMHPLLDAIYRNHVIVSIGVMGVVLAAILVILLYFPVAAIDNEPKTPEVQIGSGPEVPVSNAASDGDAQPAAKE